MRIRLNIVGLILLGGWCAGARAENIWSWTHEASGSGMGHLFDGGPPVFDEDETEGPDDDRISILASDRTQVGSLGASASGSGVSRIVYANEERFFIAVGLTAGYFPSGFPGGDNPGGEAEAELHSVIEFTVPTDELQWFYELDIDHLQPNPFVGSSDVLVENVTQSQTLIHLTSEVKDVEATLTGAEGDLIRITTTLFGSGSMGPGSYREYETDLQMVFVIPEPGTIFLLAIALPLVRRLLRHSLNN